jgi:hypothetical protein
MCQTALIAFLVIASWPALAAANEAIRYQTASAPIAAKRHVAHKIFKRYAAKTSAHPIVLGISY